MWDISPCLLETYTNFTYLQSQKKKKIEKYYQGNQFSTTQYNILRNYSCPTSNPLLQGFTKPFKIGFEPRAFLIQIRKVPNSTILSRYADILLEFSNAHI